MIKDSIQLERNGGALIARDQRGQWRGAVTSGTVSGKWAVLTPSNGIIGKAYPNALQATRALMASI